MKTYRNFTPYTPAGAAQRALLERHPQIVFLRADDGADWYACQQTFAPDTLKVVFDAQGVIRAFSQDASTLWPAGASVAEVAAEDVPPDLALSGAWLYQAGRIRRRTYTAAERYAQAEAERERRRKTARENISVGQTKLLMGRALNDAERAQLNAWLDYLDALEAVDTTSPAIAWPTPPQPRPAPTA